MLRKYRQEDIDRIVQLERDHLDSSLEAAFYEADLDNSFAYHCVWEENGIIIGFISTVFDGFSLEILNFVVDQSFQSLGYGTKILAALFDELVLKGLNQVSLEVKESNLKAISLYNKFGFKRISVRKEYYANHENALVLQKLYDEKKDIVNLEAILFSSKKDFLYRHNEEQAEAFNHYDFYDDKNQFLQEVLKEPHFPIWTNWIDQNLFNGYDCKKEYLLHTNAYYYHHKGKLKDLTIECTQNQAGKVIQYAIISNDKEVSSLIVLEYQHSFLISSFLAENQSILELLLYTFILEAKKRNKVEVYLKINCENVFFKYFEETGFKIVDTIYKFYKR